MGPVRLNLSKSGLGLSAGVKGARVGVSSQGRTYVHGGREGLYYRKYFKSGSGSSPIGDAEIYDQDASVYFAQPWKLPDIESEANSFIEGYTPRVYSFLSLPIAAWFLYGYGLGTENETILSVVGTLIGLIGLVFFSLNSWRKLKSRKLSKFLEKSFVQEGLLDTNKILESLDSTHLPEAAVKHISESAYLSLLQDIVSDNHLSEAELERLHAVENLLKLSTDFYLDAKVYIYRTVYLQAVSDIDLSETEEGELLHIQSQLGIESSKIQQEKAFLEELKSVREVRGGKISTIETKIKTQKNEKCFFENDFRMLKEKIVKTYQENGVRKKITAMTIQKEGTLIVTDKRILLVHSGSTSIKMDKILDVEVDFDRNLLTITRDGLKNPTMVTTPDALKAGAIISHLASK